METEGPLPFSQNLGTYTVPETANTRTRHPSFSLRFALILSCHLQLDFPCVLFPVCSNTNYEGWNFNSGNYLFTTDTK